MSAEGLFDGDLQVVNVGIDLFAESLTAQGVKVVSLDWRPPAVTDPKILDLLAKMRGAKEA